MLKMEGARTINYPILTSNYDYPALGIFRTFRSVCNLTYRGPRYPYFSWGKNAHTLVYRVLFL
jgi:hypothetical protein